MMKLLNNNKASSTMEITEDQLAELVEEPFFTQGQKCYQEGLVEFLKIDAECVDARAAGTSIYYPSLYFHEGKLDGDCTCPPFGLYGPCKHMAAMGLALIAKNKGEAYEYGPEYIHRMEFFATAEHCLMQRKKKDLVGMLMEIINEDPQKALMLGREGYILLSERDFWV